MEHFIVKAKKNDLQEILILQKTAYKKEADRYNDQSIPPLIQTMEEIEKDYEDTLFLKLSINENIVGSIKGKVENDTCSIGRLMVHPDYQKKGYGKELIKALEDEILESTSLNRFELFTGEISFDNIALYESQGYRIFKTVPFDEEINIVYMEKIIK